MMLVNKRVSGEDTDDTEHDGSSRRKKIISNNKKKNKQNKNSKKIDAGKTKSDDKRKKGRPGKTVMNVGNKLIKGVKSLQKDADESSDAGYEGNGNRASLQMSNLASGAVHSSGQLLMKAIKSVMKAMAALVVSIIPLLMTMASLILIVVISFLCFWDEIFGDDNDDNSFGNSYEAELDEDYLTYGELQWPVGGDSGGTVTSRYGMRWGRLHKGIDIGCPIGTPIVAAEDGVVEKLGYDPSMGNYIKIKHNNSTSTIYMHNNSIVAGKGDEVKRGQVIAYSGNTGNSTGPHCHFGLEKDGVYIDPEPYLRSEEDE